MAIGKGLLIAQQSSSLSVYKQNLSLLHARLAHYQQNFKQSRSLLKRLSSSFILPTSASNSFESSHTAPWLIYTTHLTSIAHALSSAPPDLAGAFAALQMCHNVAESLGDSRVQLLTYVLRLRTLVDAGMWDAVGDSLALAESALGLVYDKLNTVDKGKRKEQSIDEKKKEEFISFDDPLESAMAIHVLIMGVVYYTNAGKSREGSSRLSHLHALLDSDALALFPNGVIDVRHFFMSSYEILNSGRRFHYPQGRPSLSSALIPVYYIILHTWSAVYLNVMQWVVDQNGKCLQVRG